MEKEFKINNYRVHFASDYPDLGYHQVGCVKFTTDDVNKVVQAFKPTRDAFKPVARGKKAKDLTKVKHGQWITCRIHGIKVVCVISVASSGTKYICQDAMQGNETPDRFGYKYSWTVDFGTEENMKDTCIEVSDVRLYDENPIPGWEPFMMETRHGYRVYVCDGGIHFHARSVSSKDLLKLQRMIRETEK